MILFLPDNAQVVLLTLSVTSCSTKWSEEYCIIMMILLILELLYEVSEEANEYNLAPERCYMYVRL